MFTDNKDFYPTPQNLIDKMLDGLDWKMRNWFRRQDSLVEDFVTREVS